MLFKKTSDDRNIRRQQLVDLCSRYNLTRSGNMNSLRVSLQHFSGNRVLWEAYVPLFFLLFCARSAHLTFFLLPASKEMLDVLISGPPEREKQQAHVRRHSSVGRHWSRARLLTLKPLVCSPLPFSTQLQRGDGIKPSTWLIFKGYVFTTVPAFFFINGYVHRHCLL